MTKRSCTVRTCIYLFTLAWLLSAPCHPARAGNDSAPDFVLQDLEGKQVSLKSLLGKGPIILDFWATHCKPCVEELKHMQAIYDAYKDKGLQVVAISQDSPRSVSKVKSFVSGRRFTFTVLLDTNTEVFRKFRLYGLPHTFVLNDKGEIVLRRFGYKSGDEKEVQAKIEEMLGTGAHAAPDSGKVED